MTLETQETPLNCENDQLVTGKFRQVSDFLIRLNGFDRFKLSRSRCGS